MGAGVALIAAQGCRKQPAAASVQPAALSLPRVQLDFPVGPLPVEDVDTGARPRVDHAAPPLQVQPVQVQRADVQNEAVVDGQRVQDTRLLQEQETASERQGAGVSAADSGGPDDDDLAELAYRRPEDTPEAADGLSGAAGAPSDANGGGFFDDSAVAALAEQGDGEAAASSAPF